MSLIVAVAIVLIESEYLPFHATYTVISPQMGVFMR